jgi:hypothetical protein
VKLQIARGIDQSAGSFGVNSSNRKPPKTEKVARVRETVRGGGGVGGSGSGLSVKAVGRSFIEKNRIEGGIGKSDEGMGKNRRKDLRKDLYSKNPCEK